MLVSMLEILMYILKGKSWQIRVDEISKGKIFFMCTNVIFSQITDKIFPVGTHK
jgi:hypothetical protein